MCSLEIKLIFNEYLFTGWTTLVMELQKASLLPNICPYTAALATFFKEICITSPVNSSITKKYKNIRYCNSERK